LEITLCLGQCCNVLVVSVVNLSNLRLGKISDDGDKIYFSAEDKAISVLVGLVVYQ